MNQFQKLKRQVSIILMVVFISMLMLGITSSNVFANTLYVAKNGSDNNPGTQTQPFLTINKAAQMAYAGDTVIVGAGLYRECVQPLRGGTSDTNRITYQAATGAIVTIKGSEQISNWVQYNGNTWEVVIPNSFFGSYNPYTAGQGLNQTDWFPVYNCGDVYLNGEAYYQKGALSDVTASGNSWYSTVDANNTTIYANFSGANPNNNLAEINVRKQCFTPSTWGLGYITVDGFAVAHSANTYSDFPGLPIHAQAGAISVYGGLKWIIQNCNITNARSIGIDIGLGCDQWAGNNGTGVRTYYYNSSQYGQHIVRNNYITRCGQAGITGVFSWQSQMINNIIIGTNYRNEFCDAETGGIKLHYDNDGLIQGNYIKDTAGGIAPGIWTDWGNQGIRITQNLVVNNTIGYNAEAVLGPILVDNNVFVNNNRYRALDASGIVYVHNLFYNETASFEGSGRACNLYLPHSMTLASNNYVSVPQYFRFINNIFINCSQPSPPGTNNIVTSNCSNVGSGFTYNASNTGFTCSFNMDGSPFTSHPYITDAYIGNIQPANQGIGVTVSQDYLGNAINSSSPVAGPFANIKNGANNYTLWPHSGGTPPTPTPTPVTGGNKYEAENATLSGGAVVMTDHTGYSGAGFVAGYNFNSAADTVFNVNVSSAGQYSLTVRYSAGNGTSTNTGLYVNGTRIKTLTCNATTDWNTWANDNETITLNSGNNTVELKSEASVNTNINIDYINIVSQNPTYEAENATLSGGATVMTDHTGYTGSGFVAGYCNNSNADTIFNVNVSSNGQYSLAVRYSAGNGTSTNTGLYVNGTRIKTLTCNATTDWNTWANDNETITLNSGTNTVELKSESSTSACINIDYITLTGQIAGPQNGSVYHLICQTSGKVLDNGGSTADGGIVHQWTDQAGNVNQEWKVVDVGNGYFHLICQKSGKALDNSGSTADGGTVYQWTDQAGNINQNWKFVDVGNGYYHIICQKSGKALDNSGSTADGGTVYQWTEQSGNSNQNWKLEFIR